MTAHRVNYNNKVGFGIPIENGMWKVRFTRNEVMRIHESKLTIFSKHPVSNTYMDKHELDDKAAKRIFQL